MFTFVRKSIWPDYLKESGSRRNRKGFTFLELVIVLALFGVILAIALPRLPSLSRRQLETAARKMAGDLRLTRSEAISSGEICKVKFFVYGDCYLLILTEKNQSVHLPEGIHFSGLTTFLTENGVPFVHFNALGRPSGGGTAILQSQDGDERYIIVTPVTGRVRIANEPPQHW